MIFLLKGLSNFLRCQDLSSATLNKKATVVVEMILPYAKSQSYCVFDRVSFHKARVRLLTRKSNFIAFFS